MKCKELDERAKGVGGPESVVATRRYSPEALLMLDIALMGLRAQLERYEHMAKREKAETGGDTHGTCAYLQGTVVASERALEMVGRLKQDYVEQGYVQVRHN